jgi:hypothetical protein
MNPGGGIDLWLTEIDVRGIGKVLSIEPFGELEQSFVWSPVVSRRSAQVNWWKFASLKVQSSLAPRITPSGR